MGNRIIPDHRLPALARAAGAFLRGQPMQTAFTNVSEFRDRFRAIISEWQPEIVHLNQFFGRCNCSDHLDAIPVLIDLDELRSDYYRQLVRKWEPLTEGHCAS